VVGYAVEGDDDDRYCDEKQVYAEFPHVRVGLSNLTMCTGWAKFEFVRGGGLRRGSGLRRRFAAR
jgi:hypothetical protein